MPTARHRMAIGGNAVQDDSPFHTRKVGASIPAGITSIGAGSGLRCITRHSPPSSPRPFHATNIRPGPVLAVQRKIAHHVATKNFVGPLFKRALVSVDSPGRRLWHPLIAVLPNGGQRLGTPQVARRGRTSVLRRPRRLGERPRQLVRRYQMRGLMHSHQAGA
jgi:hypothetical protein